MTAKLTRQGGQYGATTPKGRALEIVEAWSLPNGGWIVTAVDGTPLGLEGEDGIHEPTLKRVRENVASYDVSYDANVDKPRRDRRVYARGYDPEKRRVTLISRAV